MLIPNNQSRNWFLVILLLLFGLPVMLAAGQAAIQLPQTWALERGMQSDIDPIATIAVYTGEQRIAPINPDIQTPVAWFDAIRTPPTSMADMITVIPAATFNASVTPNLAIQPETPAVFNPAVTTTFTPQVMVTVITVAPSLTPTFTSTLTPTRTNTPVILLPTFTPTPVVGLPSPTITATFTLTASPTQTLTATIPPTHTPTSTPTLTSIPTSTLTPTHTLTPNPTDTATPTATFTLTDTATPTATFTPTVTETPSSTPTITATSLPTVTPTNTPVPSLLPLGLSHSCRKTGVFVIGPITFGGYDDWLVSNPNASAVAYNWSTSNGQSGSRTAPALGTDTFRSYFLIAVSITADISFPGGSASAVSGSTTCP